MRKHSLQIHLLLTVVYKPNTALVHDYSLHIVWNRESCKILDPKPHLHSPLRAGFLRGRLPSVHRPVQHHGARPGGGHVHCVHPALQGHLHMDPRPLVAAGGALATLPEPAGKPAVESPCTCRSQRCRAFERMRRREGAPNTTHAMFGKRRWQTMCARLFGRCARRQQIRPHAMTQDCVPGRWPLVAFIHAPVSQSSSDTGRPADPAGRDREVGSAEGGCLPERYSRFRGQDLSAHGGNWRLRNSRGHCTTPSAKRHRSGSRTARLALLCAWWPPLEHASGTTVRPADAQTPARDISTPKSCKVPGNDGSTEGAPKPRLGKCRSACHLHIDSSSGRCCSCCAIRAGDSDMKDLRLGSREQSLVNPKPQSDALHAVECLPDHSVPKWRSRTASMHSQNAHC